MTVLFGVTGTISDLNSAPSSMTRVAVGQVYPDGNAGSTSASAGTNWSAGMWKAGNYYLHQVPPSLAKYVVVSIPMLVGRSFASPTAVIHLGSNINAGDTVTSLPVQDVGGVPACGGITSGTVIPSGVQMVIVSGANTQAFTVSADVAVGATAIPVSSATAAFTYAAGNGIKACGWSISPNPSTDTTGSVATPSFMRMTGGAGGVAGGVWDANFTKVFADLAAECTAAGRDPSTLLLRIGWEGDGHSHWYPWNGRANAAAWRSVYLHLRALALNSLPTAKFIWDQGLQAADYTPWTDGAWVGTDQCDYIGEDLYKGSYSTWAAAKSGSGMSAGIAFAASVGKPYIVSEFGLSGTDTATFVNDAFADLAADGRVAAALWFNQTSPPMLENTSTYPNSITAVKTNMANYGVGSLDQNITTAAPAAGTPTFAQTGLITDAVKNLVASAYASSALYVTALSGLTLQAATSAGATTFSVDLSVAAGDVLVLDQGLATQETVTVQTVSGAGPYTVFPAAPLSYPHVLTGPNQGVQSHLPLTSGTVHELAVTRVAANWGGPSPAGVITAAAGKITVPSSSTVGSLALYSAATAGTYYDATAVPGRVFVSSGSQQPTWVETFT